MMAAAPTKQEMAREVLDIFKWHHARAGYTLGASNFAAAAATSGRSPAELKIGIDYGYDQGWFEDGPNNSVKLTDAGFSTMLSEAKNSTPTR
jgi:hypothetical protein